jgi:hypothetical protein
MSIFKRGNVWWYEFTFGGARIRQSSKEPVAPVEETEEEPLDSRE